MADHRSDADDFRMPKQSPVDAALSSGAYSIAMRSGPEAHIAFVESILEKPSVKKSRAYRAQALLRLVNTCCVYSCREKAEKAGWELLENGLRYAHEGYYAAKQLFGMVNVIHPSLELIQDGHRIASRAGHVAIEFLDVIQLTYLELCIRLAADDFDSSDGLEGLVGRLALMMASSRGTSEFSVPMLNELVARGVMHENVRRIAETVWSQLTMYDRFQNTNHKRELAAIEAIIESLPDGEDSD